MYTTASSVDSSVRSFLINPLRILEYMLGTTCLIIHVYCAVFLNVKMAEILKNLLYITTCSFIIIISHDLILTCVRKPLDPNTWLSFSFTASVLYAICAGMSAFWDLSSYVKWIYFTITLVNTTVFSIDSLSILWHLRKMLRHRTLVLPSERSSTRRSVNFNHKKTEEELSEVATRITPAVSETVPSLTQRATAESMHSVAIQCDSLEQMDLNRPPSVHSTNRYVPKPHQIPASLTTTYANYHKRKRHGCHGCHACDPINMTGSYITTTPTSPHYIPTSFIGGGGGGNAARPATTTSTYGGTFHVSKDIAPLSSPSGSARQAVTENSTHKMKSPWTNESLYVWEAKPRGLEMTWKI